IWSPNTDKVHDNRANLDFLSQQLTDVQATNHRSSIFNCVPNAYHFNTALWTRKAYSIVRITVAPSLAIQLMFSNTSKNAAAEHMFQSVLLEKTATELS